MADPMTPTPDCITRALLEALEPFAEAGDMALISGRPPGEHVDANAFLRARAAISAARQAGERGE